MFLWIKSHYMAISRALAVLAAGVMIGISFYGYLHTKKALEELTNAYHTQISIRQLMRNLLDAETGIRGFLLTHEERYLTPYNEAITRLKKSEEAVRQQIQHAPESMAIFEAMQHNLQRKTQQMQLVLQLFQEDQTDSLEFVMFTNLAGQDMDAFRSNAQRLEAMAEADAASHLTAVDTSLLLANMAITAASVIGAIAFFLYLRQHSLVHTLHAREKTIQTKERARLEEVVEERTASLKDLTIHLQQVREDERGHLARELHDELGALLTAAKLDVARLKAKLDMGNPDIADRVQHLSEALNNGIALKRRIVEGLRPSSLTNLGLPTALEILTSEFGQRLGTPIQTHIDPIQLNDATDELTIYRLVQESLTNIGKYAQATAISVSVRATGSQVCIEITDNGIGFDQTTMRPNSHGLAGMLHRVEATGGHLHIQSALGEGTTITAQIPMQPA